MQRFWFVSLQSAASLCHPERDRDKCEYKMLCSTALCMHSADCLPYIDLLNVSHFPEVCLGSSGSIARWVAHAYDLTAKARLLLLAASVEAWAQSSGPLLNFIRAGSGNRNRLELLYSILRLSLIHI